MIYKLGTGKPRSMEDVIGRSIEVMASGSHVDLLISLQAAYPELTWVENADIGGADLLTKVAMGEVELTVSDSSDFNIQRHFYPDLRIALDLDIGDPIAWGFPKGVGDTLLARADEFLIKADRAGLLAQVHDRYYGYTKHGTSFATSRIDCLATARCSKTLEQNGMWIGACWRQSVTRNHTGVRRPFHRQASVAS